MPFRPRDSRPTSTARLLHRHAHSGFTSPQSGNDNFPRGHRGDWTQDLWTLCRAVKRFCYLGRASKVCIPCAWISALHVVPAHISRLTTLWCSFSMCIDHVLMFFTASNLWHHGASSTHATNAMTTDLAVVRHALHVAPPLHLTRSKVMVILWRLSENIITTVLSCQRATSSVGAVNNSYWSPVQFVFFSGCMIYLHIHMFWLTLDNFVISLQVLALT